MKKFIILMITILLTGCTVQVRQTEQPDPVEQESPVRLENTIPVAGYMYGVNTSGMKIKICTVYFSEFNGHTWYVFYDNLAVPSVVHDPLCACGGGEK